MLGKEKEKRKRKNKKKCERFLEKKGKEGKCVFVL